MLRAALRLGSALLGDVARHVPRLAAENDDALGLAQLGARLLRVPCCCRVPHFILRARAAHSLAEARAALALEEEELAAATADTADAAEGNDERAVAARAAVAAARAAAEACEQRQAAAREQWRSRLHRDVHALVAAAAGQLVHCMAPQTPAGLLALAPLTEQRGAAAEGADAAEAAAEAVSGVVESALLQRQRWRAKLSVGLRAFAVRAARTKRSPGAGVAT